MDAHGEHTARISKNDFESFTTVCIAEHIVRFHLGDG